jgi:DNA-binding XRE family transcriptional regulator
MIENPIKRLRVQLRLTQTELAVKAQVTRQVVVLSEQGLYAHPPAKVVAAVSRASLTDDWTAESVLVANYMSWINQKRADNRHLFCKVDLSIAKLGHRFSTLKDQVAGKNNLAFCRALVYQPSLVREFEKKRTGSQSLFGALKEVGVTDRDRELLTMDLRLE